MTARRSSRPARLSRHGSAWLVALEEEVEQALRPRHLRQEDDDLEGIVPQVFLSQSEARRQLNRWANRQD